MTVKKVGVIGGGKFGIALARLLSTNTDVLLYTRRAELVEQINTHHEWLGYSLNSNITATNAMSEVCESCSVILPVVSSLYFRKTIQEASAYLRPNHIILHGTKGFDDISDNSSVTGAIKTMSQVIIEETNVVRIGAICGPNLADEILMGLPTATVIASEFDEVIKIGKEILSSDSFYVFGSHDIRGAELAGALKNVIALASGIIAGRKLGKNTEAILIVRGLREMVRIGESMGSSTEAFFGAAGIGDLIATATSDKSRNYSCGVRIANGEDIDKIVENSDEAIEGARTLELIFAYIKENKLRSPIISTVHEIIFEKADIDQCIKRLMKYPLAVDVDYL